MAVFPELSINGIGANEPLVEQLRFKTLHSRFEGGNVSAKQKWLYPRRNFKLQYEIISVAEGKIIYDFFIARAGSFASFVLFLPFSKVWVGEFVGVGDGATTIWNLPAKNSSGYTVKVAGVVKTEPTHYAITAAGGTDGEDKITFVSPPAAGAHITFDFTGNLKVRCKFVSDEMDFETFYNLLVNVGLKLMGELNQ